MITSEARGAWSEIERRLRPYVARRVSSPADVDDILQEIFVRMHRGLPTLRDEERFGGWVYSIAQRVIADVGKARTRDRVVHVAELPELRAEPDTPDAGAELQEDLGACVALFVARLPSPYREAVTLTELQGLKARIAADILGVSLSCLKSRVQRGREKLRGMFEDCCLVSVDCRGRISSCEPRALDEIPEDCRAAARSWAAR